MNTRVVHVLRSREDPPAPDPQRYRGSVDSHALYSLLLFGDHDLYDFHSPSPGSPGPSPTSPP